MSSSPIPTNGSGLVAHIYGAAAFSPERKFKTLEAANEVLDVLAHAKVSKIDTAQLYGQSESTLGQLNAGDRFEIDTKAAGGAIPSALEQSELVRRGRDSLTRLKVTQVDIFYLHSPDVNIPIASTLAGVQQLYEDGCFRRFGLSNYFAADVELIHSYCKTNRYVLPTVYQGSYSPVTRRCESELLPTLRRLDISFYAYAPSAGGLLAKTKQEVLDGKGRFDSNNRGGQMLRGLYCKPKILNSLEEWQNIAQVAGCSGSELAIRWVRHHSALDVKCGDAMVWSSSTVEQTRQTLEYQEGGPLDDAIVQRIDEYWEMVKDEVPLDNING